MYLFENMFSWISWLAGSKDMCCWLKPNSRRKCPARAWKRSWPACLSRDAALALVDAKQCPTKGLSAHLTEERVGLELGAG